MSAALSPDDAALEQLCMFGTQEDHCGAPAAWHIWHQAGKSMECQKHMRWWLTKQPKSEFDYHQIGHVCGIAEAVWNHSTEPAAGDGSCSINWGDSLLALVDSEELVAM